MPAEALLAMSWPKEGSDIVDLDMVEQHSPTSKPTPYEGLRS